MKKYILLLALGTTLSTTSHAGFFDGIKNFFSGGEEQTEKTLQEEVDMQSKEVTESMEDISATAAESAESATNDLQSGLTGIAQSALINQVTSTLGVDENQAMGGLGAIFSQAQSNLPANDFSSIASYVPNIDTILAAAPLIAQSNEGVSNLLNNDKLQQATGTISSAGTLISQFKQLGLEQGMIPQFIDIAMGFLKQSGGTEASALLQTALGAMG